MISFDRCRSIVACTLLSFGLTLGRAQSAAGDVTYHVHGTVVDGSTNKPIPRALVTSSDRRLATLTDSEGRFAFEVSVPAANASSSTQSSTMFSGGSGSFGSGRFFLIPQRPGYQSDGMPLAVISLDDSLNSTSLELKLMPAAAISGHVVAGGANSFQGISLMLLRHQAVDGELMWAQIASQTTNSRGEFRFSDLRPGEYAVRTLTWRGENNATPPRNAISQQYPPTYFGDTRDVASATKVRLHFGDTAEMEIHLGKVTYYPVTVPVPNAQGGLSVVTSVQGDTMNIYQLQYNTRDHAVEGALPNGSYELTLTGFEMQPPSRSPGISGRAIVTPQQSALVSLHVESSPVQAAPVALAPGADIPVRIDTEFTQKDAQTLQASQTRNGRVPPMLQLFLRSEGGFGNGYGVTADANGDLKLSDVRPGRYRVVGQPFAGYIASLTCNGADLLKEPLVVLPGGSPSSIDVTLRDNTGAVGGSLNYGTESWPQTVFVALLPVSDSARFSQVVVTRDGTFTARNVAPGSYRLLVVRGAGVMGQFAYRDAEAMKLLEGKGSTVEVSSGETAHVDLSLANSISAEMP